MMRPSLLKMLFLFVLALMVLGGRAHAQTPGQTFVCIWVNGKCSLVSATNPFPTSGGGGGGGGGAFITPNGTSSLLTATTVSSNVALPSGTAVTVFNNGTVTAYVALGTTNAVTAAVATGIPVPAGGSSNIIVGSNTYIAGITAASSAQFLIAGGSIPGFSSIYALSSGAAAPPYAALSSGVYKSVQPSISTDGNSYPFTVDTGQRENVNTHPGTVPSAGAGQSALAVTTATNLTPPAGAVSALIQCTGDVYWRDDGTAPTASTGFRLAAYTPMSYAGPLSAIQLIQVSSATCTILYYK